MADLLTMPYTGDHWNDGLPWAGAVLPAQFYSDCKGPRADDPIHRLMRAILADAIRCFQTGFGARQPTKQRLSAEALSWILDESDGVFSFRTLCDLLEIDPIDIRKGLACWWKERVREKNCGRTPSMLPGTRGVRRKRRTIALRRSRLM
ncbi:MAG: hypothetical protein JO189_00770 [Deltaproteobacteria bacterium]|nr:hypothetical protein [Deltaproteobacteria bacterium]